MIGQFLGCLAIILTPIFVVAAIYYPPSDVTPVLGIVILVIVGMGIHHMELFREVEK